MPMTVRDKVIANFEMLRVLLRLHRHDCDISAAVFATMQGVLEDIGEPREPEADVWSDDRP